MNRITEDSGETNLRLQAASYVDTRILRAILDHQHDAGTDWFGEFEAAMKNHMNREEDFGLLSWITWRVYKR